MCMRVILLVLLLMHADCNDTPSQDVEEAGDAETAADEVTDPTCHTFGDGSRPGDRCWAPPEHYCADGETSVVTRACSPSGSLCCLFAGSCIPCGWEACVPCRITDGGGTRCSVDPSCTDMDVQPAACESPDLQHDDRLICQ